MHKRKEGYVITMSENKKDEIKDKVVDHSKLDLDAYCKVLIADV